MWCCLPAPLRGVIDSVLTFTIFPCYAVSIGNFEAFWHIAYGNAHTAYYDWFVSQYFAGEIDCGDEENPLPAYALRVDIWTEYQAFRFDSNWDCDSPCPMETGIFALPA